MHQEHPARTDEQLPRLRQAAVDKLSQMALIAGIVDSEEIRERTEAKRQAKRLSLGRRVVYGALTGLASVGSTLGAGEALDYRPAESAHVEIIPGLPEANKPPSYKSNRVSLSLRGFAREIACEMAEKTYPVTSKYGEAACLVMNPKNIDQEEIISALEETLLPLADDETGELELNIYAQSAGAKMTLGAINEFVKMNPNVHVGIAILDSSPHNKGNVLGGEAQFLVNNPEASRFGMVALLPGQVYSLSKTLRGHSPLKKKTRRDATDLALGMRTAGLRRQAKAIDEPLPDLSAITQHDPRMIYLRPAEPDVDKLVDTSEAFDSWHEEFAKYGVNLTGIAVDIDSHAPLVRGGHNTEAYLDTLEAVYEDEFAQSSQR